MDSTDSLFAFSVNVNYEGFCYLNFDLLQTTFVACPRVVASTFTFVTLHFSSFSTSYPCFLGCMRSIETILATWYEISLHMSVAIRT